MVRRCCEILLDYQTIRCVIAEREESENPIVFIRFVDEEKQPFYCLYMNALTAVQADEIFQYMEAGDTRKANRSLKRYFNPDDPSCEAVGEDVLEKTVPDSWRDVWVSLKEDITGLVNRQWFRKRNAG